MKLQIDLPDLEFKRLERLGATGRMLNPSQDPADMAVDAIRVGLRVLEREHCLAQHHYANLEDDIACEMIVRCAGRALLEDQLFCVASWNSIGTKIGRRVSYEVPSGGWNPGELNFFSGRISGPACVINDRAVLPLDDGVLVPLGRCRLIGEVGVAMALGPVVRPSVPKGWSCERCGLPVEDNEKWAWDGSRWLHCCPPVREVLAELGELPGSAPRPGQEPDSTQS